MTENEDERARLEILKKQTDADFALFLIASPFEPQDFETRLGVKLSTGNDLTDPVDAKSR